MQEDLDGASNIPLFYLDLHLGNILLQLPWSLDHLSDKKIYDKFGPPEPEPVVRMDGEPLTAGVPSHVFSPVWLGDASEKISLVDATSSHRLRGSFLPRARIKA